MVAPPNKPPPKKQVTTRPRRSRDDFSARVLKDIAAEVGHLCSNPDCNAPTSGPSKQRGTSSVGVGAHITAAAKGGPRYARKLTPAKRSAASNALWLCNNCGRLVDNDTSEYTVAELRRWKTTAIKRAQQDLASGGRASAEKVTAAQLDLQRQGLAQQQQMHEQQVRDQQRSRFSDMYTALLTAANTYAGAIDDYFMWMFKSAYMPDRSTRSSKQQLVKEAYDAMERAQQSILLSDGDEERGSYAGS